MEEMRCPACGQTVMSIKRVESLLQQTTSKVLMSQCLCGKPFEIRSPTRNVFEISTSSGEKFKQILKDDEGPS